MLDIIAYVIIGLSAANCLMSIGIRIVLACYDCAQREERRARENSDVIAKDEYNSEYEAWKEYGMHDEEE